MENYDQIRLVDIIKILNDRGIPTTLIKLIRDIYTNSEMKVKRNEILLEAFPVEKEIRQGAASVV